MQTRTVLTVFVALAVAMISNQAWAQGGTYGGGVIAPGGPPVTLSGNSGGPRNARMMGSSCRGTIAMAPDHVFNVVAPMTVRFEVLNASGDTTMVVMGPSGVMCDDDGGRGNNPRIIRHLMPGQYQVFIGTYGGRGMYPYTLQAHGQGAPAVVQHHPVAAVARFGAAILGPRRMFANLSGTSGGPMPARNYGGSCRGHVAPAPNHTVTVRSPMVLTFDVQAPGDTTLIIIGPGGTFCNDDGGNGFNPRVTRPLQPGVYQVYVGSYSRGRVFPYTLSIHP